MFQQTTRTCVHHHSRSPFRNLSKEAKTESTSCPKSLFSYGVSKQGLRYVWAKRIQLRVAVVHPTSVLIQEALKLLFWALAHLTVLKLHSYYLNSTITFNKLLLNNNKKRTWMMNLSGMYSCAVIFQLQDSSARGLCWTSLNTITLWENTNRHITFNQNQNLMWLF